MAFNQNISMVGPYASSAAGATGSTSETVSIPATGDYTIQWKASVPTVVGGGGQSGLVVRIRNVTAAANVFLGVAGACNGGEVWFAAAAGDSIQLNLSSTAAADLATLNTIQAVFSASSGV